jgi:hypothetical protein
MGNTYNLYGDQLFNRSLDSERINVPLTLQFLQKLMVKSDEVECDAFPLNGICVTDIDRVMFDGNIST